jgi:hypothetical protein
MSRLQSIENAVRDINETIFQELCDSYLAIRNDNYAAYSRIGSMSGKQKTRIGTPDSFLLLPSGKYIFVECSTNITLGVTKLAEDINKCLDTAKTGIVHDQIAEIILCINFNLNPSEIESLRSLLANTRIRFSIISRDSISIELHLNHRDLAFFYLGLPLDTGQVVSMGQFIAEYNKAANYISTPLNNIFNHRENELANFKNSLELHDFIILTGAPGVGKTKLSLEVMNRYLAQNLDYQAYCISYKNHTLLDDLFQYINPQKNYLLFVDDANRIDAFSQITGLYRATRVGNLKIIITVRDYAYREIETLCREFAPVKIDLYKLTDEAIRDIVRSDSFQILNENYIKEIIRIADGNPRLAIMAALLAKAHQNVAVLHDVSDLFEHYFSTFIKDYKDFENTASLKCLGLIGFFYTLPYKDRELVNGILRHFDLEFGPFLDTIDNLEKMELVEIQFEHVKIPEQNLAIYFFYRAVIKDSLLSFYTLLEKYFDKDKSRFRECVIATNNTFGPEKVMNKLKPDLIKYWNKIKGDKDLAYAFLDVFWFYLRMETFEYLLEEIACLEPEPVQEFVVDYDHNDFAYNKSETIELIGEYFQYTETLNDALSLAFRFAEKLPVHLAELIHKIREKLMFDWKDERSGFRRQNILLEFLVQRIDDIPNLYSLVLFELAKSLLKYKFQHTEGGRNHSFSWYYYPIPNNNYIQDFRRLLLETINLKFKLNPVKAMEVLESYANVNPDVTKEIMFFDLPRIINIIDVNLINISFEHCRYVQNQLRWWKRMEIFSPDFERLEHTFVNSTYEMFLKIDWNRIGDKEMYEYGGHREYEKLKEKEIRSSFAFFSEEQVDEFYKDFIYLKQVAKNEWNYNNSLEFIIDENLKIDFNLGFYLYTKIIQDKNKINFVPRISFRNQLNDAKKSIKFWNLIIEGDFKLRLEWKIAFFEGIEISNITDDQVPLILDTITSIEEPIMLQLNIFDKYWSKDKNLYNKILTIISIKNDQNLAVRIWMDFFSTHFDKLGDDFDLIKKTYLQQYKLQDYFDYELQAFQQILNKAPDFLREFVDNLYKDREFGYSNDHRSFKIIWNVAGIEKILIQIFEVFAEKSEYHAILPIYLNTFFRNLDQEHGNKADNFLLSYIKKSFLDPKRMNLVVDIVRHERKHLFETILLEYVSLNTDAKDFKKIWWRGNGGTYTGDVIMGDMEAADWRSILLMLEKSKVGIDLIPIKKYVLAEESSALKYGDHERKRRFIDGD